MKVSEKELRFRSAYHGLKKELKRSYPMRDKLIEQENWLELIQHDEFITTLEWTVDYIESWLKKGREL
jgi:hypothetical protein